jgi:thiol-disulfide isomerase/thioredoxin
MATTAPAAELGWQAPDFQLRGTDGQWHRLTELAGARGTVVAFICNHCPYVKAVLPRLVRDARELAAHGVNVIAINANDAVAYPDDSFERMVELARDWPFPYLHDETQQTAREFGAVCTPDFFGLDGHLRLRYRGRLDASLKATADSDAPRELFDAMCMIAESGQGPAQQHPGMGCSIKWRG